MMKMKSQLRLYLRTAGYSAAELSRRSGVPNATIADWLAGTKPRSFEQVKKVADVFGITIDHLVFGEGSEVKIKLDDPGDGWATGIFEVKFRRIKTSGHS